MVVSNRSKYLDDKIRRVENNSVTNVVPFRKLAHRVVQDPYTGERQSSLVNNRGDLLGAMRAKRVLKHDWQLAVARHIEQAFERSQVGGVKAMDFSREPVDGGQIARDGYHDGHKRAYETLAKARQALGADTYKLIETVLRDRHSLTDVASMTGHPYELVRERFRTALTTLAETFGLSGQAPSRKTPQDRHAFAARQVARGERGGVVKLAA
jgi:hypothetical protein